MGAVSIPGDWQSCFRFRLLGFRSKICDEFKSQCLFYITLEVVSYELEQSFANLIHHAIEHGNQVPYILLSAVDPTRKPSVNSQIFCAV